MTTLPWTYEPRPDTRTSTVRLGIWLFLASEAMFFGSVFSAYVLLRAGAADWPDIAVPTSVVSLSILSVLLLVATRYSRNRLDVATLAAVAFLLIKATEFARVLGAGLHPASRVDLACWFVLSGLHWLHVAGGVAAMVWLWQGRSRIPAAHVAERAHALWLYWCFVDLVWAAILVSFYLI